MSRLKRLLRAGLTLPRTAWVDLRYNQLGQRWPAPPHTLNLLVNDICNSRCQMCYIWQQKRDDEISPAGLAQTLQDPLFRRLRYIGVSGGEPTLRRDLPDLFRVITEKRPQLRGTGIITNAIRTTDVIERVGQAADICQAAGLPFSLMVSLDGVGDVHDLVRGRPGNFASAMQVIDHFRTRPGIELLFGCTITKDNVWHVDELLDFARQQGLYGRFRVAEFINRLYNEQATTAIRSFSAEEAYHLALFFARLAHTYETNPIYQNTYHSIRGMLLGHKRATKCPYQSHAVVMDCRGQLLYCSPKSPILASTLDQSAERIYLDNIPIRQNILRHHCDDCIHDYHAPPTTRQVWQSARRTSWRLRLRPRPGLLYSQLTPTTHPAHRPVQSALIIGWYGTETAGDKAILGEIIHRLHHEFLVRRTPRDHREELRVLLLRIVLRHRAIHGDGLQQAAVEDVTAHLEVRQGSRDLGHAIAAEGFHDGEARGIALAVHLEDLVGDACAGFLDALAVVDGVGGVPFHLLLRVLQILQRTIHVQVGLLAFCPEQ